MFRKLLLPTLLGCFTCAATSHAAMTLVEVADLLEEGALLEIEVTAVLP